MENIAKPNIAPIEVEIENKVTLQYLYSVAIKCGDLSVHQHFGALLSISPNTANKINPLTQKTKPHEQ